MNTFESALKHPVFTEVLNILEENRFYSDQKLAQYVAPIPKEKLKKAVWLASILSTSDEEVHKQFASNFAELLYLNNCDDLNVAKACYVILSRSGNILATNYLEPVYEKDKRTKNTFSSSFSPLLDLEIGTKRNLNKVSAGEQSFHATDFQRELWSALQLESRITVSAPTSAGKSFFIENFIIDQFTKNDRFIALYIVPTRALITQVSNSFRSRLPKDISLHTAFIEAEQQNKTDAERRKELYIITPERCLRFLQAGGVKAFAPNFIFIDEIQNLESNDNRGVLFEFVISEIARIWSTAKLVFAGPFIKNSASLYADLTGFECKEVQTILSPVYQLKLKVRPVQNMDKVRVLIKQSYSDKEVTIDTGFDLSEYKTYGDATAAVLKHFGKDSQNIIYVPKTNWCESYAMKFAELSAEESTVSRHQQDISDLVEFLSKEIHPKYYLIDCLKKRIAFHHGKLPDVVRSEIEYLYRERTIQHLFCTATLLQGVNLPAEKMFISLAKKDDNELSNFEFGNLIGRAGRINEGLYGSIYCLESKNNHWADRYLDATYSKQVITTVKKTLHENFDAVLKVTNQDLSLSKHDGIEYTSIFLKHKFITNRTNYDDYLKSGGISEEQHSRLTKLFEVGLSALKAPNDLFKLNPTIDPVLQDKLFNLVMKEGLDKWTLVNNPNENPNFYNRYLPRYYVDSLPYKQKNFFGQLEYLFEKLDKIFFMWKEAFMMLGKSGSLSYRQMAFYAITWLQGSSYSKLIEDYIKYYSSANVDPKKRIDPSNREDINWVINKVINVNQVVITYIVVKYTKLLKDVLELIAKDPDEREKIKFTLSLPTMLELGTSSYKELILINNGLPRIIALKVGPLIPDTFAEKPIEWLRGQKALNLDNIYLKYLRSRGFLS